MFKSKTRKIIFPQSEHGRLAGIIAQLYGNSDFQKPNIDFYAFTLGVALHDLGFGYFDTYAIREMNQETRLLSFKQLVEQQLPDHVSDTVAAYHVLRLLGTDKSYKQLKIPCKQKIERGVAKTGINHQKFNWADRITDLCDSIAFDFCFQKPTSGKTQVYASHKNSVKTTIHYQFNNKQEIILNPWPFKILEYESFIYAYRQDGYPNILKPVMVPFTFKKK